MSQDRVAIITGASKGIGASIARKFSHQGYRVALVARSKDLLEDLADEVSGGADALVIPGDLHDLAFCEDVVKHTVEHFGQIDVLVNNAVWREVTSMRDISPEVWDRTLRISLTAPAFLTRWAAEEMIKRKQGVVINVSSIQSRFTAGICPAYVACKGALDALTYEFASLYSRHGIRVVGIRPGAIDTELSHDLSDTEGTRALTKHSHDMIALGRWGTSEEVANVILFLASDSASYVNGTNVVADGGWEHQIYPLSIKLEHMADSYR